MFLYSEVRRINALQAKMPPSANSTEATQVFVIPRVSVHHTHGLNPLYRHLRLSFSCHPSDQLEQAELPVAGHLAITFSFANTTVCFSKSQIPIMP
jgi:hypothetical protein